MFKSIQPGSMYALSRAATEAPTCTVCGTYLDPSPHWPCERKFAFCPSCLECLVCGEAIDEVAVIAETEEKQRQSRIRRRMAR